MRSKTLFGLLLVVSSLAFVPTSPSQPLDSLGIQVTGTSREFAYTNKQSAFYYGETGGPNRSTWQGFTVSGVKFLDDYDLLIDGEILDRSSYLNTIVYPDYLIRTYPNGITEQLRPADSLNLFAVIVTSLKPVELSVIPYFSDGRSSEFYQVNLREGMALVARRNRLERMTRQNTPVWLAVYGQGFSPIAADSRKNHYYSPVSLHSRKQKTHFISFAVAANPREAEQLARTYPENASKYFTQRRSRMEKLLRETRVATNDERFDKALALAKLSLDALVMNQMGKGIFAGLPWFNDYWGRDTFISLPGATLVTGQFSEARKILMAFAEFQQTDSTSTDYGRIPNRVTISEKIYNTADATPRFVMMAREYAERSGDTTFMVEVYPAIIRSIEGTLRYHTDSLGFLVHEDAETWMDAVGPNGPWSPRGNRANDIQALWAQQLQAGIWFATHFGDITSSRRWNDALHQLKRSFASHFIVEGNIVDHLNSDWTQDRQLRPNQIFTFPLVDADTRAAALKKVVGALTYEYGLASLSQDDEDFHPYHIHPPYYPKDAAYHNGVVWTWLQGQLISELNRVGWEDLSFRLTSNTVTQILNRGAVGTQSELLDAIPREGKGLPDLAGTFSQAWNLAEFVRNFYDDYLGVRVNLLEHKLVLRPRLPKTLGRVNATVNLNGRGIPIELEHVGDAYEVVIDGRNLRRGGPADVVLCGPKSRMVSVSFMVPPKSYLILNLKDTALTLYDKESKHYIPTAVYWTFENRLSLPDLASPAIPKGLRSLQPLSYRLLSNEQVKATNRNAPILYSATDQQGDDTGTGAYSYPEHPAFHKGIFDITTFQVSYDDSNAYFSLTFSALSNPGWHREYGFQLTFVAIAVDQDGGKGSGTRFVRHNANYQLQDTHAYEKLILIGGGLQIEDAEGRVIAAYHPSAADIRNPLGDVSTGVIEFAIPLSLLGIPSPSWTFTILSGGQDDHGGAGLGEFRTINSVAGEWTGGGKRDPSQPNVYDIMIVPQR